MNRGYVKLWRKSLDAGWIRNPKLWAFWTWCLMKATHKEYTLIVGLQAVHLMPGQFVFGRRAAAKETGLSEQEIRTIIAFLVKAGNLTIKTTNKFSIITIINWPIYQGSDIDNQPANQPTTNQQLTTNKNVKKNNTYRTPTLEEVTAYCNERKNGVDPQVWMNHYQAIGWMVGKNKMRDWKATVRTWEQRAAKEKASW